MILSSIFRWWRRRQRRRVAARPIPAQWTEWFDAWPLYGELPNTDREPLRRRTQWLVEALEWEGCDGLVVTEEMKVAIGMQAALLVLHREEDYTNVPSVLLYPGAFVNPLPTRDANGVVSSGRAALGEAWQRGPVILDWSSVVAGRDIANDGRNVVLHEFAHKLDMLDGYANGVPPLKGPRRGALWQTVMSREFEAMRAGGKQVLDRYGATNPAEFFAVAAECFFEKAKLLRSRHSKMYEVLANYFRQDPAEWSSRSGAQRS